jgi:hypothetical protein
MVESDSENGVAGEGRQLIARGQVNHAVCVAAGALDDHARRHPALLAELLQMIVVLVQEALGDPSRHVRHRLRQSIKVTVAPI